MLLLTRANLLEDSPARPRRRGTTMMEYLMMISLIVVVCLIAIGYLGTSNNTNMTSSANAITKSLKKGG
jgi:uncharacterized protein (UPF0333 family)